MKNTQEKKSVTQFLKETKDSFAIAVKDKKRWCVCLIELAIVIALIGIDLITKQYIYGACKARPDNRINIIKGVICFSAVENTGASFGIFAGRTMALTIVSTICAAVLLLFLFYSYKRRNLWLRSALILIIAGAIGNIIDRIAFGYVRDFIYFELINFAVFNFADSCLTAGTIVLIIYVLFFYSEEEKKLQGAKHNPAVEVRAEAQPEEILEAQLEDAKTITKECAEETAEKTEGIANRAEDKSEE